MGWHGIPARLRSLEEAMTTLGLNDIGVDTSKLTPEGIRQAMANGEVAPLDRVHALYGHVLPYGWVIGATLGLLQIIQQPHFHREFSMFHMFSMGMYIN